MALAGTVVSVLALFSTCFGLKPLSIEYDGDFFKEMVLNQSISADSIRQTKFTSKRTKIECMDLCTRTPACQFVNISTQTCSLYTIKSPIPYGKLPGLEKNSTGLFYFVDYRTLSKNYQCLHGILLTEGTLGMPHTKNLLPVDSFTQCFIFCINKLGENCNIISLDSFTKSCMVSSADFYDSWISQAAVTTTNSCFKYRAGKFKMVYKRPKEVKVANINQVTGPWFDQSFYNQTISDSSHLLLNGHQNSVLKSGLINIWGDLNVSQVKISMYKNSREQAFFVYSASESNYTSWFRKAELINSSYTDLNAQYNPPITGWENYWEPYYPLMMRGIYIAQSHGGCGSDWMWLLTLQNVDGRICSYETVIPESDIPVFFFSPNKTAVHTSILGFADYVVISIALL